MVVPLPPKATRRPSVPGRVDPAPGASAVWCVARVGTVRACEVWAGFPERVHFLEKG